MSRMHGGGLVAFYYSKEIGYHLLRFLTSSMVSFFPVKHWAKNGLESLQHKKEDCQKTARGFSIIDRAEN